MRRAAIWVVVVAGVLATAGCGSGGSPRAGSSSPPMSPSVSPSAPASGPALVPASVSTRVPASSIARHGLGPHVVAVVSNLSNPSGVAGAAGDVWVSEHRDDVVAALSAATLRFTRVVALPATPDPASGELAGPGQPAASGSTVWVPGYFNGELYRLDARTGTATGVADPGTLCGRPVPTPQGVWTPTCTGHALGSVVRLDPRTGRSQVYLHAGDGIGSIAVVGSRVWVADYGPGRLREVDQRGRVLATRHVRGCPTLSGYAFGYLWYTTGDDPVAHCRSPYPDRLFRFDPRTGATASVRVASSPEAHVADGAVWIDQTSNGSATSPSVVQRVSPQTLAVTSWARIPALSEGSTIYDGRLWVPDFNLGTLTVVSLH